MGLKVIAPSTKNINCLKYFLAAHCIHEKQSPQAKTIFQIYAFVGRYDLTKSVYEPNSKMQNIKKITIHPTWKPKDVRYDADIAILQLQNLVTFSDLVQPVCLPPANLNVFTITGRVVGWGKSESTEKNEVKPKQVEIPAYGNEDCFFADYRFAQFGSPRTFCAGERGKTPCQGDSGGGFFTKTQGSSKWTIAGIVSAAIDQECGQNDFVLFTNIAKFTPWIEAEVKKTYSNNEFDAAFNALDEEDVNSRVQNVDCKYQLSG